MVYSQRFVMSVLVNGQVQQERPDGSVFIPFGCEYALRFRNKHDRRAVVKLFIDGEEQSKGGYVVGPHSYKDIERNSFSAKKYKFVSQDSLEAQDNGKDPHNINGHNGVIEARFYLEKDPKLQSDYHDCVVDPYQTPWCPPSIPYVRPQDQWKFISSDCVVSSNTSCSFNSSNDVAPTTTGVTVEGTHSSQTFKRIHVDLEKDCTVLKLVLKGECQAAKSTIVLYCPNCGANRTPQKANFCHVCGHRY